jgi:hypothetical protein
MLTASDVMPRGRANTTMTTRATAAPMTDEKAARANRRSELSMPVTKPVSPANTQPAITMRNR